MIKVLLAIFWVFGGQAFAASSGVWPKDTGEWNLTSVRCVDGDMEAPLWDRESIYIKKFDPERCDGAPSQYMDCFTADFEAYSNFDNSYRGREGGFEITRMNDGTFRISSVLGYVSGTSCYDSSNCPSDSAYTQPLPTNAGEIKLLGFSRYCQERTGNSGIGAAIKTFRKEPASAVGAYRPYVGFKWFAGPGRWELRSIRCIRDNARLPMTVRRQMEVVTKDHDSLRFSGVELTPKYCGGRPVSLQGAFSLTKQDSDQRVFLRVRGNYSDTCEKGYVLGGALKYIRKADSRSIEFDEWNPGCFEKTGSGDSVALYRKTHRMSQAFTFTF